MSPRAFQSLLWATVLAIALAIFVVRFDRAPEAQRLAGGERAAPFGARSGDVGKIAIETKDFSLTFEKKGADWVATDRGNYPARPSAVANLMTSLNAMRLSERKTAKPALFAELGVEDRKGVVPCIARVDHESERALVGEANLFGERQLLGRSW